MIKIGASYYKNIWAFILVEIFRRPNLTIPKDVEFLSLNGSYNFPSEPQKIVALDENGEEITEFSLGYQLGKSHKNGIE